MGLTIKDELLIARRHLTKAISEYAKEKKRTDRLQEKLDIALEALEFYAKIESWGVCDNGVIIDFYDIEELDTGDKLAIFGGKKAREALAKIKEKK